MRVRSIAVASVIACFAWIMQPTAQADDSTISYYAWGMNTYGELGLGSTSNVFTPTAASNIPFVQITAGEQFACGLDTESQAYCWGFNNAGNLGTGDLLDQTTPTPVQVPSSVTFDSMSAGLFMACALSTAGNAYCWGDNTFGQLGNGGFRGSFSPVSVQMPGGVTFSQIASGSAFTCAMTTTGSAYCWGSGSRGQLGDGLSNLSNVPAAVSMPGGVTFVQVVAAERTACALATTGNAYCWGDNNYGQVGNGGGADVASPQAVTMPDGVTFDSLVAGGRHMCGVTRGEAMYCWGRNNFGQLGIGNSTDQATPQLVPASSSFKPLSGYGGWAHTCAIGSTQDIYCWGENTDGQLGNGTTTSATTPQLVAGGFQYSVFASGSISDSTYAFPLRAASGDQVPTAPMQQFARGVDEKCDRQPDDLVDFPALGERVKDVSWGPSWAWWPNEGTGGFVCTRQPYYTSLDTWAVR